MSGNPYISAKSATTKAENAPKERQSRQFFGRVKLKAKATKTADITTATSQYP